MPNAFTKHLGQPVPQTESLNEHQIVNNTGGYVFKVSDEARLRRFLHLGVDGGTYYQHESQLTKDSAQFLIDYIKTNEQEVITVTREVSLNGTAFRNSPAIFVVAMLFVHGKLKPRQLVQDVCRTGTHLFEFAEYIELLGGWGDAKKKAVDAWYNSKTPDRLAYQVVKYRQRNGWTHRDLFRLAHPKGSFQPGIGEFILNKPYDGEYHPIIKAFKTAQEAQNIDELLSTAYAVGSKLPWEAAPTQFHNELRFWKRILTNGQLNGQALLRNVTRFAKLGAFTDMRFAVEYAQAMLDEDMMRRTRLHPFQYVLALKTYEAGVDRRGGTWTVEPIITKALNDGFYKAFKYVEPANKRTMIALDVSSSMSWGTLNIGMTAAEVAALMAMTIARTEPMYQIMAFAQEFRPLSINPSMSLAEIISTTRSVNFGGTDCSVPMLYARTNRIKVDTFVVLTDSETWAGDIHPKTALDMYRKSMDIPAKLIVVACAPNQFSIADPQDFGMLDVVGADSSLPTLIANFSAGRF